MIKYEEGGGGGGLLTKADAKSQLDRPLTSVVKKGGAVISKEIIALEQKPKAQTGRRKNEITMNFRVGKPRKGPADHEPDVYNLFVASSHIQPIHIRSMSKKEVSSSISAAINL